jgi:hypothetical protein
MKNYTSPLLVYFSMAMVLAACGETRPLPDPESLAATCPSHSSSNLRSNEQLIEDEITLVQKQEKILRLNCDGSVRSEKIEITQPARSTYYIEAQTTTGWDPLTPSATSGSARNRTTCSAVRFDAKQFPQLAETLTVWGGNLDRSYDIPMVIDLDPKTPNTRVIPGLNYIDYEFKRGCGLIEQNCNPAAILERGTLILNVKVQTIAYRQGDRVRTVDAPAVECVKSK